MRTVGSYKAGMVVWGLPVEKPEGSLNVTEGSWGCQVSQFLRQDDLNNSFLSSSVRERTKAGCRRESITERMPSRLPDNRGNVFGTHVREVHTAGCGRRRRRSSGKVITVSKSPARLHLKARVKQLTQDSRMFCALLLLPSLNPGYL